ncbi:type II toxin-antitoxin system VapC family toxin [Candidatus Woesearchaeota archaeon]|nr:type II toxin-antitoxin system VapC family toxin [Candidatus Woesearchaeota archaeon]
MSRYYIDSCIWLNLFKKEGDETRGKPYHELAEEFLNLAETRKDEVVISTFVLKELKYVLKEDFVVLTKRLNHMKLKLIEPDQHDYSLARFYERLSDYRLSFGDCMHMAISKRYELLLITRDRKLLIFSRRFISAHRPEELLV